MTESNNGTSPEATEYQKRDRSKKPLIITIALLAIAALVAAVIFWANRGGEGPTADDETGENGAGTNAPSEIVVGLQLEPTNLDIRNTGGVALDQILIDNIYQGLIGLKSGSVDEFVPVLATDLPEVSEDGLTYTFELREGVTFHSGGELTADDVVASYSATEGRASLSKELGAPVTVTAPDASTVELKLSEPNSQTLWHLANRPGLVFEQAYEGDLTNTANGTGPFVLGEWKQGDSISFKKNENYWGDEPGLDSVVFSYVTDANAAVNAALEGDLDVLAPVQSAMVSRFEGSDFTLGRADASDVFTLGFNTAKAPLDDVRVRTAISKAINSESIVEAFYGDGKVLGGPVTDIEAAYEDLTSVNAYDPEGAKALLAEAGQENLTLTVTLANFYGLEALDQVVSQLAAVGITLNINQVEFGTWLQDVYLNKDFDLSYVNHAEPNDFVNYTNPDYYFGYNNAEVQSLYAQSIASTDAGEAVDLLKQAARQVAEDAPAKWLINYTPTNAVAGHVSGFPNSNTNSRINLADVKVAQ